MGSNKLPLNIPASAKTKFEAVIAIARITSAQTDPADHQMMLEDKDVFVRRCRATEFFKSLGNAKKIPKLPGRNFGCAAA
jgi:hypothetical protein